jgi:DNA-directed RNA polymerase beta subunit
MPDLNSSNSILTPDTREFGDVNALRGGVFQQAQQSAIAVAPFEPGAIRNNIFNGVVREAQNIKPIQNDLYTLSLQDVGYEGPETFSKREHKAAILSHGSLARKLRGTWTLTDNATGKPISQKRATIANVPYLTHAGTFVNNGVEYTLAHQMRLRAGVYTREKDNGELEAHVNVLPGKGRMHRYFLDPKTGVFKINIGQAQIPLMPMLKAMGVPEQEIRKAWGNELTAVNMEKGDAGTIDKLYNRLVYKPVPGIDAESKQKAILEEFSRMEMDPEVTRRTLGEPIKNLTPDAIMKITKKLIAVNRKEIDPDDRDSMAFQQVFGPEDLIAERFTKDRNTLRQLLWKATAKKTLDHVPTGVFNKAITAALVGSGLGSSLEEINPAEIFDHQARVTRLGEGGIGSLDAVPVESRSVQPSHFGFVDYLRTPECYDSQTEVMTRAGWKLWPAVTDQDEFACLVDGQLEFHKPDKLHESYYVGELYGAATGKINYLVTPNHRMYARSLYDGAQYKIESAETTHLKFRGVLSAGFDPYSGIPAEVYTIPAPAYESNNRVVVDNVSLDNWAELLGWYLGEGSCVYRPEKSQYHVKITQCQKHNPDNCDQIRALLNRLPFKWGYHGKAFSVATKQLAAYFKQFNGSTARWIPEEFLDAPVSARFRLFDALMKSEGRRNKRGERTCFCTASHRLALDFERLSFGLGYSCKIVFERDKRPHATVGGAWVVHVHKHTSHHVLPNTPKGECHYFRQQYAGLVYCATVPGGLLYVRRKNGCGFWCGNSGKVGVDMRFARGALKGSDGKIYMKVKNLKTGELEYKSPQDIAETPLAFPGEDSSDLPNVAAIVNGKMKYVPREDVQYMVPDMDSSLSSLSNMVPMKAFMKGHRVIMGSRMFTQALPLVGAEAPFIQSAIASDSGKSYEDDMGKNMGAVYADGPAQVVAVTADDITLRDKDGNKQVIDLYNDAPFNRKTFWTQKATVQPGDTVKPGQLLATSNFTDKNGTAALGLNMRVGYLPFKGYVYDDAVVISESAAKRLTSEHMYQHEAEADENNHIDKKKFVSLFPQEYDKKTLENFDDNGVIKKGATVKFGDPLILVSKANETTYGQVYRGKSANFSNDSVVWNHHAPGTVTDVTPTKKGFSVVVKNQAGMEVGDKLTGRFGDKGVVAAVIPDEQMPQDAQNRPLEVLVSPLGLASRINPAQLIEAALGKVVEKTGQPFKIKDFDSQQDLIEFAKGELRKNGLQDLENVTDPDTGRKIKDVLVGNRFFMKLHHTAEAKAQGRSTGGYTAEGAPAKGGETGSKRIGTLDLGALLSHGAGQVIRDAKMVRGQANPEYWSQFMAGYSAPLPKIPQVYTKFVEQLRGSGINTVREGTKTHIMALTDKDIDQLSGEREIQNAETVDWKSGMRPKAGGLFDETLTGGHNGNRWAKITLAEPMPNPVMEEPIRRVLGLTENKFRDVLAGREQLDDATGPQAISAALKKINLPKAIEQARQDIQSGRKTLRDAAVRKLAFLKSAEKTGVHPENWMLKKMPVIPPMFRPVSTMGQKKMPLVADANYLYKELLDANGALKESAGVLEDTGDARLGVYDAMKGVTGLGDPTQAKNVERRVRGFLSQIFGNSPKYGTVQRKLLSSTVDLVGRAVITPNPDLDMDQVALPEEKAWEIYKPFIVRGLVRRGLPRMDAVNAFDSKNKAAHDELQTQMSSRPIVINRAPVLHRYGMMAFYPRLTKNKVMEVSPLVTKGFGADFDGDAMQYHVPSTDEAAKEAIAKMLPSRNLFAASTFKAHYTPVAEFQSGLYVASNRVDKKAQPKVFRNKKDAIAAYRRGDIEVDTPVHIVEND